MKKLEGKKILVTGGSKGIGKGVSKMLLKQGATLYTCSRNLHELENTRNELSSYGQIEIFKADITDIDDIKKMKEDIQNKFSNQLDVLINNASILGLKTDIMDYPFDVWNNTININLNAQFYVTRELLPLLLNAKNASIINVSSSVGRKGRASWGAYAVSKFGLEGLTQVLADELKDKGIRVNSVNPGGTQSQMRAKAYPDEDPGTIPSPEDISPIFVYLASDESIDITGKEFNARDYIK